MLLGGATDVGFLLGSLYVYEGSKERLAAGLVEARCTNPIFFFDEVDKVSATERGAEIINVLIHLTTRAPTARCAIATSTASTSTLQVHVRVCTTTPRACRPSSRPTAARGDARTDSQRGRDVRTYRAARAETNRTDLPLSDGAVARILDDKEACATPNGASSVLSSAHVCDAMGHATGTWWAPPNAFSTTHDASRTPSPPRCSARDRDDALPAGMYR